MIYVLSAGRQRPIMLIFSPEICNSDSKGVLNQFNDCSIKPDCRQFIVTVTC